MIAEAILIGRVGKKDSKTLKAGGELTLLSVATSKKFKDKSGTNQEITSWHLIYCYSKLAEIVNKYINVGDLVYVMGDIQNKLADSGERSGQYVYSIHANVIRSLSAKKDASQPEKTQSKAYAEEDDVPW